MPWKVVWVTGASTGIGFEVARQLAAGGAKVAISSRKPPQEMPAGDVTYFSLDVTDANAVAKTVGEIEAELGPIDLAVFAAGMYTPFAASMIDAEEFRRHTAVNYGGVTNCISALVPRMMARRAGHISWFASLTGYRGLPKSAYYGPTKAALINLAECLKLDLEPFGLKVSVINPGFVETPMTSVNDFKMPFLMQPSEAAVASIKGLARGNFEVTYPRRFAAILKLGRILPYWLYFALTRKMRSKGSEIQG